MALTPTELELQYRFYSRSEPALDAHLADILNWYTAIKEDKEAREYLEIYFKEHHRLVDLEVFKRVPDTWIPKTAAFMAHLDMRGRQMSSGEKERFEKSIQRALKHAIEPKEPEPDAPTIQDKMNDKVKEIVAEIEGLIDDSVVNKDWSLYKFFKLKEVGGRLASKVSEAYQGKKTEDKEIQEIYRTLALNSSRYAEAQNQGRKPRKKKQRTASRILQNFVFLKESPEYQVASIDPTRIIGAKELWTFNPKYKILSVYKAKDKDGLNVDYTKITGYDDETSGFKTIGRKTEETIREILGSTSARSKRVYEELKGKPGKVTRITKDMLLLKVHV